MAFDKPTCTRLAKFVSDAGNVVAGEFTDQLQSLYGISTQGKITPLDNLGHLDDVGLASAALLRERIDSLEKSHPDDVDGTSAAVARLAREQAFPILLRFASSFGSHPPSVRSYPARSTFLPREPSFVGLGAGELIPPSPPVEVGNRSSESRCGYRRHHAEG